MIHIISPHIDDAILSLGGTILKLKESDNDLWIHYIFTESDVEKKEEEKIISEKAGYKYIFYDFPYMTSRDIDNEIIEKAVAKDIESRLLKTINCETDVIFFPMGLEHPDHQRVREIGISLFYSGFRALFYEDMPDAAKYDYKILLPLAQRRGFYPELVSIDMEEKVALTRFYKNQHDEEGIKDLKNYAYNLGENKFYERFWKPKGDSGIQFT